MASSGQCNWNEKKNSLLWFYHKKNNHACFWIPTSCPDVTDNILELGKFIGGQIHFLLMWGGILFLHRQDFGPFWPEYSKIYIKGNKTNLSKIANLGETICCGPWIAASWQYSLTCCSIFLQTLTTLFMMASKKGRTLYIHYVHHYCAFC